MSFSDRPVKWIVTCEHGGNKIPFDFQYLFKGKREVLNSHRGMDLGVKSAFNQFKIISDFWIINQVSRLLIEFNRSLHHPKLYSEFSRELSIKEREKLVEHYYLPYRNRIVKSIEDFISEGHLVVHLSIHSFTPVLDEKERNADIGLLYDPGRSDERRFCYEWKRRFSNELSGYRTRMNYPYLGKADGLTTFLRKKFVKDYIGVEVELNQKHVKDFARISRVMTDCLPRKIL